MGFLAPFAPLIGGAVGGLLGGRSSKLEKQISSLIKPTMDNLTNWAGQANFERGRLQDQRDMFTGMVPGYLDQSRGYEPMARGDLGRASGYYNRLLSPSSREALNEILGPQRQGVMTGYQNVLNTIGRTQRGGGRASGLMNYDFAKNTELMNLVPQARMMAAQGLLNTSGAAGQNASRLFGQGINIGNLGLGYGQLGLGYGNLAEGMSRAVLGQSQALPALGQARAQAGDEWGSIGGKIGTLLGPLLGSLGKKKGSVGGLTLGDFAMD